MRGGTIFFCVIVALPFLAVLGHDIYFAYIDMEDVKPEPFKLTDIGWLWTTYSTESYDYAISLVEEDTWNQVYDPILKMKALYVTGSIAAAFYSLLLILKLLNFWPFTQEQSFTKKKSSSFSFDSDKSNKDKGPMKYKRK